MKDPRTIPVVTAEPDVFREPEFIPSANLSTPESGRAQDAPSMVERVAKAMYEGQANADRLASWNSLHEWAKDTLWRRFARAAIEAMREPTEAMVDAVAGGFGPTDREMHAKQRAKDWRSMIDEALK